MKIPLGKILIIATDLALAVYLLLAFTSFDKKGKTKTICNKVNIEIADKATNGFIDANTIKQRLTKSGLYPMGKPLNTVSCRHIEEMLRTSPFVQTAQCYKTNAGHIYISVTQRMPIIRVMSDFGDDYYIDDNNCIMPRSNYTSDLIIASGNISRWYAVNYISPLAKAIMDNDMWRNLIEQIHLTPAHGIELVPRVGDHIVYMGRLPDGKTRKEHVKAINAFVDTKMTRLLKFYKYGLSEVGWNKYDYINIEFDNQIICTKAQRKCTNVNYHTPAAPVATQPQPQQEAATPANSNANAANGNTNSGTKKTNTPAA